MGPKDVSTKTRVIFSYIVVKLRIVHSEVCLFIHLSTHRLWRNCLGIVKEQQTWQNKFWLVNNWLHPNPYKEAKMILIPTLAFFLAFKTNFDVYFHHSDLKIIETCLVWTYSRIPALTKVRKGSNNVFFLLSLFSERRNVNNSPRGNFRFLIKPKKLDHFKDLHIFLSVSKWSRFYVQLYIRLLQNFWIRRHECWKNHRAWSKAINNNRPNRKVTLSKEVTNGHERSQTILMGRAKLSEGGGKNILFAK